MVLFYSMPYILDIQGYRGARNTYVIKEIGVVSTDGTTIEHYVFKTSVNKRYYTGDNAWIIKNYHQLDWSDGETDLRELEGIMERLLKKEKVIYMKGIHKQRWIRPYIHRNDYSIKNLSETPQLKDLWNYPSAQRCSYEYPHCALENAFKLYNWLMEKK
ncbi:unnamed protein product [Bemisia tabaci]|uniref:Uncharacterized protein n=1 Tax=Bemisia tabaci TaxID=7038 RepID=A0A9P0ALL9_BEMTA|nr:unnamed protein product [Bemisia tabaci]